MTYSFYGPTQGPRLTTANTGKTQQRFWKNAGELTARVEICKEEIPGSKYRMYGYVLTYSRLYTENLKLCVPNRWDFNFCVRELPTAGAKEEEEVDEQKDEL